jgi:hypothetical protein
VTHVTPGIALEAISGVVLMGFAAGIAWLRPRRRANLAFATVAGAWGFVVGPANFLEADDPLFPLVAAAGILAIVASIVGLVLFALWFPRGMRRGEVRMLGTAAFLTAVAIGVASVLLVLAGLDRIRALAPLQGLDPGLVALLLVGAMLVVAGFVLVLVLLPLRFAAARSPDERRQYVVMAVALEVWYGVITGNGLFIPEFRDTNIVGMLALGLMAALWLRNAARCEGAEARVARNVGLVALLAGFAGMFTQLAGIDHGAVSAGARVFAVLLLTYAILRRQLFGIDVKVKWTLRQSTVAAAFVGVFFVVSESAQQLFATSVGPYLGIAAAGLLLFALAPLQHFAERVADKAMPGVKALSSMDPGERARVYRELAAAVWADGSLSRDERAALDQLQASLGLPAEDALRIEREAARGA